MTQPTTSCYAGSPVAVESLDTYLIFNTLVRSQITLPELPVCAEREADITIVREEIDGLDDAGFAVRHHWRRDGGPVICTSARRGTQYRLLFPGRASFHIRPDNIGDPDGANERGGATIACSAWPGAGEDTMRQLLLGQVIPRYLAHRGALLLHASAVTLPAGKTVAFLGSSGQGKSTLASYCQRQGAHLIDDDCILLRVASGRVSVVGGVPAVRLYPDSARALGLGATGSAQPCAAQRLRLDKQQLALPTDAHDRQQPRGLDALLLLDQPAQTPGAAGVSIRPASGQAAMMALLQGAFHLDPADSATLARGFAQAAAVLGASPALPVHHLCYPRRHERLPDVLRSVLDFLPG